jgi:hypothetical protein
MRPSPALVVALLALATSLSGVSYAALKLKANTVGAKQLKAGAVTGPKLATASVDSTKIADGAVGPGDVASGAVGSAKLANGAVDSAKIADGTVTRADTAPGVLVTAYARINNNGTSSVAPGAVNVVDTDDLTGAGNVIVSFNPAALPGGSLAGCTVVAQAIALANAGGLVNLNAAVATNAGVVLSPSSAQVQTFNAAGTESDLDFFVEANCPAG